MKIKKITKFYFFVVTLLSVIAFIGCSSNKYEFLEGELQNQTYFSQTGNVVDGIFVAPPQTPSGMSISAEKDTFRSNTEITVTEKKFTGNGSPLLVNAETVFEIRGVVVSENKAIAPKEIKSVEKAVKVVVPNTIRGCVNGYFLGLRDDDKAPWKFQQINHELTGDNPMKISSVRADVSGSEFTFYTNRLGFQFALFADLAESSLLNGATVIENTVAEIKSLNASAGEDIGKIKIKDNKYSENMKVCVKVIGKNVNKLTPMDYKPVLQYVNSNSSDNKKIFKNAKFDRVDNNSGTSDGYVHNVTITDFDVDGEILSFILNTDGISVSEFPLNFMVTVKDSGNVNQTLPFEYANSLIVKEVEVVEPAPVEDEPDPKKEKEEEEDPEEDVKPSKKMVAPRNVIVSNSKFSLGQNITISWDSGNPELENVVYDILMANGNASETVAAASLTETIRTLDASENTLGVGSYTIRIAVRNNEGKTLYSDYAIFYIVDDTIPETSFIELEPLYIAGENITIKWDEVNDPLGNSIIYSLWLWNADEEIPSNTVYLGYEPSYVARNIATGTYKVKVIATNGSKSSESGAIAEFKVYAFTKATISIDNSFIGDDGLYSRQAEFNVSLSEKNYNRADIEQAVKLEGSDGSIQTVMSWNDDVLNVKFSQLLERNHTYRLSMNPCNDIYGNEIAVFDECQFTTFFFEGKGDLTEPYTWEMQPDIFAKTSEGEIPLIGSVTVDISEVFRSFTDISIDETASILNGNEVIWADMALSLELNKIIVGIGNENMWAPSQSINLKVSFSAQHNGKTIYFETASKVFNTESGNVITMGSGTSEKPYLVYTANQLNDIRNHLDSDISLVRDIDLAGYFPEGGSESEGWQPIGEYLDESTTLAYTGSFEGNGRTISNLRINSDKPYVGLFGAVKGQMDGDMKPASIRNLNLINADVISNYDNIDYDNFINAIGCLAGKVSDNSEIINIKVEGQVAALNGSIGGITGYLDGTHFTCNAKSLNFNGTVKSIGITEDCYNIIGGCIGFIYNGVTSDMHSAGNVIDESDSNYDNNAYGGVAGRHNIGLITDSDSTATVIGHNSCGGVIGHLYESDCKNCHYTGNKIYSENYNAGGLIGLAEVTAITNCSVKCDSVHGHSSVGGFIGSAYAATVNNCSAVISDKVISDIETVYEYEKPWDIGGFIGYFCGDMLDCNVTVGRVESTGAYAGGFFGAANGEPEFEYTINNCYCEVESVKSAYGAGGFSGSIDYTTVINCKAKVNGDIVTNSYDKNVMYEYNHSYTGGFAGSTGYMTVIAFCSTEFESAISEGYNYAGGFAGCSYYSNISNCYAKGNLVSCADVGGGLIGTGTLFLNNCYTTVKVECEGSIAGEIIGYLHEPGEAHSCFSLRKGNGSVDIIGNSNTVEFGELYEEPEGYISTSDWGFHPWSEDIWNLNTGSTPNLPVLKENQPFNKSDYPYPDPY